MLRKRLVEPLNFIQVVLGPRQVGKTTGLKQLVDEWNGPKLMVSADEIAPPTADWIAMNWRIARARGPGTLFVIDEIQKIPGWSRVVKQLFDEDRPERKLKVVLLGSAGLVIQQGLADSLAGRFELVRAGHWSFTEAESAFGWDFDTYIRYGCYPGSAEIVKDAARWKSYIKDSIIEPVLLKDLLALTVIHKPALFRQTFDLAMAYPAQEVSLQKLLGQLQESGNVSTVKHYLEIFEGAYLLKALQKYSGSLARKKGSSPKLVPMSNALVQALYGGRAGPDDPEWHGRLLESAVGAELCGRYDNVYYWRDGRHEVDYVVPVEKRIYAVEVKSGRTRRASGLAEFCARYSGAVPVHIGREKALLLLRGTPLAGLV